MTEGYQRRSKGPRGVGSLSRGFGFWEIEANSQLPPLVECRRLGGDERASSRPPFRPLSSSFLRFAGYFDVPNLIEGIRRTDLLTSSLLIAVLFAAGESKRLCTRCNRALVHTRVVSLSAGATVFVTACNRADALFRIVCATPRKRKLLGIER